MYSIDTEPPGKVLDVSLLSLKEEGKTQAAVLTIGPKGSTKITHFQLHNSKLEQSNTLIP